MFKRRNISVAVLALLASGTCLAQAQAQSQSPESRPLEKVVVTGSMIPRTSQESVEAVTRISTESLKEMGITTVEQALQQISANQSTALGLTAVAAYTGGGSYASMRGLGASKTLILLDGKRLANNVVTGTGVDLNGIPFAAIDRIEVLREGASSVYGSDAIAGVINFITKKDLSGGEVNVNVNAPQHSGGSSTSVDFTYGLGNLRTDGYNMMIGLNVARQNELTADQRPFSATGFNPALGLDNQNGPMGTWPGSYTDSTGNIFQVGYPACAGNKHLDNSGGNCAYLYSSVVDLIPVQDNASALISFTKALSGVTKLNLQYLFAQSKMTTWGGPQTYSFNMLPSSPFFPNAANSSPFGGGTATPDLTNPLVVGWTDPNNNRYGTTKNTEQRFLASLTGEWSGWDYNTALVLSKNENVQGVSGGYANYDVLAPGGIVSDLINPFGQQSAAGQALIDGAYLNGALAQGALTLINYDLNASREVGDFFHSGRQANLALGMDIRSEKISYDSTDLAATLYTATFYPPNSVSGSRNVGAVYGELSVPLTKEIEVTLADRFDKYSDFGSTNNAKFTALYQPSKFVTFRGAASTGFRAPSLVNLFSPQVLGAVGGNMIGPGCATGNYNTVFTQANCSAQGLSLSGGNPNLQPEKSKNINIGIVLAPVQDLGITIDYYNIEVTDQIQSIPNQAIYADPTTFAGLYHLNASGSLTQAPVANTSCPNGPSSPGCGYIIQTVQNTGGVKTSGFDLSVNYLLHTAAGNFRFGMEGTSVSTYELQSYSGGKWDSLVGRYSNGYLPATKWQHLLSVDWSQAEWGAGLSSHYLSGYTDQLPDANGNSIKVDAYSIWNGYVSYKPSKTSKLLFGVRNLFDTNPPFSNQNQNWQAGYNPVFSDPLGRTFYVKLKFAF